MPSEAVARRYAAAVYSLASEQGVVERVGSDLNALAEAVSGDPASRAFFISPIVGRDEKARVLSAAFSKKAHDIALHTVLLLVRKRREPLLSEIVRQYRALEMQAQGAEPVTLATANPVGDRELREIVSRLEKAYGKRFAVTQRRDPHLIGGLRITMGDRRIDGSVERRLQELTRTLAPRN